MLRSKRTARELSALGRQHRLTWFFLVSDQQDKQEIAQLERVNSELTDSLERCRALLRDCRTKLAANSNDDGDDSADEESRLG